MPLIAIEYSKTTILPADARAFLKGLHSVVHNTIDADFNSIKSWLCPHQQFLIRLSKTSYFAAQRIT